MRVAIFIDGKRLDMFDDEPINFIGKATNLNQIGSVFMDFTQTFSVPASKLNNFIFQYYYESAFDNSFNAAIRVPAYIEIGTLPFRTGKIELNNVVMENGQPTHYQITFYSDLINLTDLFGDDELSVLTGATMTSLNHAQTGLDVLAGATSPTYKSGNVIYPLISPKRTWRLGSGAAIDPAVEGQKMDITSEDGAIDYTELKPAVRLIKIIEAIEERYSVSFSRDFFGKAVFQDLFMWCSNSGGYMSALGSKTNVDFATNINFSLQRMSADSATNIISISTFETESQMVNMKIIPESGYENVPYKLSMKLVQPNETDEKVVVEGSGTQEISFYIPKGTVSTTLYKVLWNVQSSGQLSFKGYFNGRRFLSNGISTNPAQYTTPVTTTYGYVRMAEQLPKIKVKDFIGGIVQMFNLVIRPTSATSFYIDTLTEYYSKGDIFEGLEQYIDTTKVTVNAPTLNKLISFKYQKSDNILGTYWRQQFGGSAEVGYGDLRAVYPIDKGEELKIELPFENMLFERLQYENTSATGTTISNVIIGESIKLDFSENNPKAILFYNNGLSKILDAGDPIKFKIQSSYMTISEAFIISNENNAIENYITNTINYNTAVSPWIQTEIDKGLYTNYWKQYIENIYNRKQRLYNFDANLPPEIFLKLSLDDRINIKDKQYRINDFSLNLVDGAAKLNLVQNFYDDPYNIINVGIERPSNNSYINTNRGIKFYDIKINTSGAWYTNMVNGNGVLQLSKQSGTGVDTLTVKVMNNESGADRTAQLNVVINGSSNIVIFNQEG